MPLGQWISMESACFAEPRPKCARLSLEEGHASDAADVAVVGEAAVAVVFVEGIFLVGEVGDDHVGEAVVVVVLEVDAHAGEGSTVTVDGHLGGEADFFEGAIAHGFDEVFLRGVGCLAVEEDVAALGDVDEVAGRRFSMTRLRGQMGQRAKGFALEERGKTRDEREKNGDMKTVAQTVVSYS
jgi:hypothetical protein